MATYKLIHPVAGCTTVFGGLNFVAGEAVLDTDNTSLLNGKSAEEALEFFAKNSVAISPLTADEPKSDTEPAGSDEPETKSKPKTKKEG